MYVTDQERSDLGGNMRHGDAYTWSPNLWKYLVERFAIRSVLDVGCGEGHAVLFFHRLGLFSHGIDGLIQQSVVPICKHDLLVSPYIMPVDLVWSCEVAEHIDPDKVDNFLDTLSNGRIVAMTHATPGQLGHNHVNCQPAEYWIEHMNRRGYELSSDTHIFRNIKEECPWTHFSRSGLVFLRNSNV